MRIKYKGHGSIQIDGAGVVSSNQTIEVSDDIGKALVAQSPDLYQSVPLTTRTSGKQRVDD